MREFVYVCPDCKQRHQYGSAGAELYCGVCIGQGRKVLLRRDYQTEGARINVENLRRGR